MWYAIQNRRSGKLVGGTDFSTHRQRLADEYLPPKLFSEHEVNYEFKRRRMNPNTYRIVPVALVCSSLLNDETDTYVPILCKVEQEECDYEGA